MNTGISLYCSTGAARNEEILAQAAAAGVSCAFTSLQIPEEAGGERKAAALGLLGACKQYGIPLIVDVGADTAAGLGCNSLYELQRWGITALRLDDGFCAKQAAELSREFQIVFNASTVTQQEIEGWQRAGADLTRFTACHNFYPKPWTGLSLGEVGRINRQLKSHGFRTMAFVAGDYTLRGPLRQGLPTVEAHRSGNDVVLNALQLWAHADCDTVLVGDIDLQKATWQAWADLGAGFVRLPAVLAPCYAYLAGPVHHDRPDSSEYVFRSVESRRLAPPNPAVLCPQGAAARQPGDILVSNRDYLRYAGEVEIARRPLPADARVNLAGHLCAEALPYLPYLRRGFGVQLVAQNI